MNDVPVANLDDPMAIGAIIALVRDLGATWIEGANNERAREHRVVWTLLRHHVFEHQLALGRTAEQRAARINALAAARSAANTCIRTGNPDPDRERLAVWLSIERTKLLMATKADAIAALDRELFKSRRQLPQVASASVRAVALEVLGPFDRRVRIEAAKPLVAFARRLPAGLEGALVDRGEVLSRDAMRIDLTPDIDIEGGLPSNPCSTAGVAAWSGVASRHRIAEASRAALVDELEVGSLRATTLALGAYDAGRREIHHRFCKFLEDLVQSVKAAAEFADQAQRGGDESIAWAHRQVDHWFASLSEIARRLG